jgi:hypothetical protein
MATVDAALAEFFSQSRLPVLFAGAGVSARAGLPTWSAYLRQLGAAAASYDEYTKYFIDDAVKDGALEDAATYFLMCRKMPEATRLRELARPLESFDASHLRSLIKLPFQSIVTTNFDRALFAACAKQLGKAPREINIDDPTLDGAAFAEDLYIARIHGRVEVPSSMRLSREQFVELGQNTAYKRFLEHLVTRRQVLFLGFSFLDPAIVAVLRAIRTDSKSMHGQEHWALIPTGAPGDFIQELEAHSIRRIEYDPEDHHNALWKGIDLFETTLSVSTAQPADVRELPFSVAKKYLATAFARAKVGRQREPLAQAIAEGVVSGVIQHAPAGGVSEVELVEQLKNELSISEESARALVSQAVTSLARDGLCLLNTADATLRYAASEARSNAYEDAIARLADGAVNRYVLREKGKDTAEVRIFLQALFGRLLLQRGWELGAAYAARRMPDDVDVSDVIDHVSADGLKPSELKRIARSVEDLLMRPDDEEASLLAELGRLAFGLELLLEAPHDAMFLQRTLPERIYFDANVIMPAITPGHPHYQLFKSTISALQESAGGAVLNVSLRVYDGFLNEVLSHRQLAREAMRENGGEGALWEARAVGLFGTANVNVFVGAYFNYRESNPDVTFEQFIHREAPYNSEAELRKHLERLGFEVIRDTQVRKQESAEILHALEKFYAGKLEHKKKSAVVIGHDAAQLAIINAELHDQVRSMLVSADRGIRFALEYEGFSSISNAIMTHLGLAQLVELLIGRLPVPRGMASLLWMSPVSNDTNRIRNYLISLALKEHNVALAMSMGELVDDIAEDAAIELSQKKVRLEPDSIADRVDLGRILERYESDFFKKMNLEIKRREAK